MFCTMTTNHRQASSQRTSMTGTFHSSTSALSMSTYEGGGIGKGVPTMTTKAGLLCACSTRGATGEKMPLPP